jgi:hypothetical protein
MSVLCEEFPDISHIKYLSGQDYPIKPVDEFERAMVGRGKMSSMDINSLPRTEWIGRGGLDRVEYSYFRVAGRFIRLVKRRLPNGIRFYGGSQFWCLARDHCRYVLAEAENWLPVFRHSLIPDEMFFQTMLMNSNFSEELVNEAITYVHFVGSAPSPSLLGLGDFPMLIQSPAYFARKFDIDLDPSILDALDRQLGYSKSLGAKLT